MLTHQASHSEALEITIRCSGTFQEFFGRLGDSLASKAPFCTSRNARKNLVEKSALCWSRKRWIPTTKPRSVHSRALEPKNKSSPRTTSISFSEHHFASRKYVVVEKATAFRVVVCATRRTSTRSYAMTNFHWRRMPSWSHPNTGSNVAYL